MQRFIVAVVCLLLCGYSAWAKTVYARTAGGNWSTDATWSTTSGGAADTTAPIAGDTVYIDANSGQVTVDVAAACAILDCTNCPVTGGLVFNANITTTGNVTLVAGMIWTPGTSTWNFGCATTTLTPGGNSFYNLNFNVSGTVTLAANVTVTNLLSVSSSAAVTLSTNNITCNGGLTMNSPASIINQTITLNGTGTWSGAGPVKANLVFDTAGTITVSGAVVFSGATMTYTAGTITTTGSTLNLGSGGLDTTLNTLGVGWNNVTISSLTGKTLTLTSALDINGNLTYTNTGDVTIITSDITVASSLSIGSTGSIIGTRTITLDGTGTGTWSSTSTGAVKCNLTINRPGGTVTIGTNVYFGTSTLTYTAGTVTTTSSTLNTVGACTLATNGITWNNLTIPTGSTATLSSAMAIGGNLSLGATSGVIACGTYGVTLVGNLTNSNGTGGRTGNNTWTMNGTGSTLSGNTNFYNFTINAGKTVHLTSGETYAATGTFTAEGSSGSHITFDATTPSTDANWNVTTVGTVNWVDATDIDSSGGSAIAEANGTLVRTVNWTSGAGAPAFNALFMAGD